MKQEEIVFPSSLARSHSTVLLWEFAGYPSTDVSFWEAAAPHIFRDELHDAFQAVAHLQFSLLSPGHTGERGAATVPSCRAYTQVLIQSPSWAGAVSPVNSQTGRQADTATASSTITATATTVHPTQAPTEQDTAMDQLLHSYAGQNGVLTV